MYLYERLDFLLNILYLFVDSNGGNYWNRRSSYLARVYIGAFVVLPLLQTVQMSNVQKGKSIKIPSKFPSLYIKSRWVFTRISVIILAISKTKQLLCY